MAAHVLAIDQGTTGTTVLVVGEDGRAVARASQEFRQHYPRPGWVEHDPEEIWQVTLDVAGQAVQSSGLSWSDIRSVGITNQRETTVVWDRATGEPVHNAIVWQDRRTAGLCRRLQDQGQTDLFRSRTGLVIDSYFAGTKLRWLLDNVDGLAKRASAGELAFGTIDSWLVWRLTGGRVHATDVTNASRTLLMRLDDVTWDDELCDVLQVPREVLPEICPSGHVYADTDPDAFHGAQIPIAGILGDQQSALFAQACFEPGLVKNTYGTGSFVLMNTGERPLTDQRQLLATAAVGIGDLPTEYALEGSIFVTGAAVQWLRDELGIIEEAGETEALAGELDGNDDVYFVPALAGLGAPHWDPYARGTIVGLTRGTTRAHLARATLESIAYQSRDVIDAIREESGQQVAELRADGGASANGWLMQFQADLLGLPVDVPEDIETTSLGSAYVAGLMTGVWDDRDELQRRRATASRYEPRMSEDERETLYTRWQQALERARGWAEDDD